MHRRDFLAGSLLAAAPLPDQKAQPRRDLIAREAPSWYELRRYYLHTGQAKVLNDFHAEVLLPALQRLGVGPVGVFETTVGPEMPMVHLLIPHASPAALATLPARLAADPAYRKGAAAAAYHGASATQPPYLRMESALLQAFDQFPQLEKPAAGPRLFELRTYESATEAAHEKKVEMFARLGEIEIFRRCGLQPVFFARTIVGPRLPSLVYMLAFPDMAAREKAWATFRADPEWQKLRTRPGYTDAEIVSNITDVLLRPAGHSQI
jgi:hypothetical protein